MTAEIFSFQENGNGTKTRDGWIEFCILAERGGRHVLQLCYDAPRSCPCQIRMDGKVQSILVACSRSDTPQWFLNEGIIDLAQKKTTVAFKPVNDGSWPNLVAFRFVPEGQESLYTTDSTLQDKVPSQDTEVWRHGINRSPSCVTFSFEIGLSSEILSKLEPDEVENTTVYLQGKALKFIFGQAHDCITIDGDPMGDQQGGDNFPYVTFVDENDYISTITLGLSDWIDADGVTGFGAFTGLTLENCHNGSNKHPLVGARLVEPTWTYDRNRLGLNLWLTSVCAPVNKTVARYGFTLSSADDLDFNEVEFVRFWDWLVQIKTVMTSSDIDAREQMQPLQKLLLQSFSGKRATAAHAESPMEGYLYGTHRHISITYSVFSIYIYRLPDGNTFQSTLFVRGKQHDTDGGSRMEELRLGREEILALAISTALKDTDLLFQMGLIRPQGQQGNDDAMEEVELLPLFKLGGGSYDRTVMARRVINILIAAGLRRVTIDTVLEDKDGWDIYDVGSGKASLFGQSRFNMSFGLAALVCSLIQVVLPVFIIYRGTTSDRQELEWDVYLARLFFGLYAIFYEAKTWDFDNGDRVTGWLCFLPEFNSTRLVMGMLMNKLSKVVINAAIIVFMLEAYTVADVTLNALALYFVFDVDDQLVDDRALEDIRRYQKQKYFVIKSKTSLEYTSKRFSETDLPVIGDLPAAFFVVASRRISTYAVALLLVGCVWIFVEPWIRGWDGDA